jgi:hypothetical protein
VKYPVSCSLVILFGFVLGAGPLAAKQLPGDINRLVEQLDSPRFAERQAASHKVTMAGIEAIKPLKVAAIAGSREQAKRAIEVLQKFLKSGEVKTRDQAHSAMVEISTCDNKAAALRAKSILEAAQPAEDFFTPRAGVPLAPIQMIQPFQFGQGQIRLNVQIIGNQRMIQIRNINGVKDITVKEGSRTIKIHDDPNQGIQIEITEKKDGKQKTEKYTAKDAQNLKKQHPEIYKLYVKHSQGNPAAAIRLQVKPLKAKR